jgi:undecaprenyl-diphosphatase
LSIFQALILGIVQGATEFLPISSSGHLVLLPWWFGWDSPALAFATTLHLGTLVAVIAYFYRDLWEITLAWLRSLMHRDMTSKAWLGWWLILGTVPAVVLGLALEDYLERLFGSPPAVAALLLATGAILVLSEYLGSRRRDMDDLGWIDAVIIGFAQACAIAPGISRSGTTIAAGLKRGLKREDAARFSFLLSIPIIAGTGLMQLLVLASESPQGGQLSALAVGFFAAAVTGYFAIRFLLRYMQRGTLYPFAIYCWVVGSISLIAALL